MAIAVTHDTVADGTFSAAGALHWDAAHTLTGTASVAQGGTGLATIAALSTWVANALDTPLVITPGAGQSIRINAGNTSWEAYTPAAAGATLNGITAATGAVTIASGNNTGIVWNWANTTNTTVAFTLGETTAATNGTSTGGIPNQVLAKFSTLAASTMSPLSVYARGTHVFSASPTTTQLLFADGTASAPVIGAASETNTGVYFAVGNASFSVAGSQRFLCGTSINTSFGTFRVPNGSAGTPSSSFTSFTGAGLFATSNILGVSVNGIENSRFIVGGLQASKGTADAVSYALNVLKSRGSVASPTVITTGDDLGTLDFFGYVGATNTYQSAARIVADSTGTISDSTTGIGGIWRFLVATVGAEPVEVMNVTGNAVNNVMGLSTTMAPTVTTATVNTTAVASTGAGPDILQTYDLPASAFSAAGKGVHITVWGTSANTAEAKTIILYFGSTAILTNALTTSIAGVWRIEADVYSTGTDAQQYVAQLVTTGTAGVALNDVEQGTSAQDDGAAITIKCTGTIGAPSTAAGLVQEGMIVKFHN